MFGSRSNCGLSYTPAVGCVPGQVRCNARAIRLKPQVGSRTPTNSRLERWLRRHRLCYGFLKPSPYGQCAEEVLWHDASTDSVCCSRLFVEILADSAWPKFYTACLVLPDYRYCLEHLSRRGALSRFDGMKTNPSPMTARQRHQLARRRVDAVAASMARRDPFAMFVARLSVVAIGKLAAS